MCLKMFARMFHHLLRHYPVCHLSVIGLAFLNPGVTAREILVTIERSTDTTLCLRTIESLFLVVNLQKMKHSKTALNCR